MGSTANPDERFDQVESILSQLSNSFRHLLTAQVLMNDRLDRAEAAIQKVAEQSVKLTEIMQALAENHKRVDLKIEALADGQKHTDSKLDALTDIVRQWIERHGNGSGGQHPS